MLLEWEEAFRVLLGRYLFLEVGEEVEEEVVVVELWAVDRLAPQLIPQYLQPADHLS